MKVLKKQQFYTSIIESVLTFRRVLPSKRQNMLPTPSGWTQVFSVLTPLDGRTRHLITNMKSTPLWLRFY